MSTLYYKSGGSDTKEIVLDEGESVLTGLLRDGVDVPYGCKTGVCQSCMMKSEHSDVPRDAQKGYVKCRRHRGIS